MLIVLDEYELSLTFLIILIGDNSILFDCLYVL